MSRASLVQLFWPLLAALAFLASCGVKTHPYPEIVTLPGAVEELTQEQDAEGNLYLSWKAPIRNAAGRDLGVLAYFAVEEAWHEAETFCEGCPSDYQYRRVGETPLQPAPPGLAFNPGPYRFQAKLAPGRVYRFRVAGVSPRGAVHPDSWREVTVWASAPPARLDSFRAVAEDPLVRLSHGPLGPGEEIEIEKKEGDGPFVRLRLEGASLVDSQVAYERSYVYRARRVVARGASRVPGPYSPEIAVTVVDSTPPRPIAYLDAALAADGVRLSWESLKGDGDILGYRVYRRLEGEDGFRNVGGTLAENFYLDRGVPPGVEARYRVTALDDSPRRNESFPSPEASVLMEPLTVPGPRPETPD